MNAAGPSFERQEVQARLVEHADHLAEQHVHVAVPLVDDGVEAEHAREPEQRSARR